MEIITWLILALIAIGLVAFALYLERQRKGKYWDHEKDDDI